MKTDLYVTCATDREQLELLDLLRRRGYRFPGGKPLPGTTCPAGTDGPTDCPGPWTRSAGRRPTPAPPRSDISAACGACPRCPFPV